MKFELSDEVGKSLITTLVHELLMAREEYSLFGHYLAQMKQCSTVANNLSCYRAYSEFLRHLYEYYVGIFKWNDLNTKSINHDAMDLRMNDAANRVINFSRHRKEIEFPDWPISISGEFGAEFRTVRNRASHADYRRAQMKSLKSEITLGEFFMKYHRYIDLLYEHACFTWTPKDMESHDWGDMGEFCSVVIKSG